MKLVSCCLSLLAIIGITNVAHAESAAPPSLTIAIVGDSTVSTYAPSNPLRGWGQMLPQFLDEKVKVVNLAISGMSTRTFRPTGNWDKALQSHPDFVLIQFGHNDSHAPDKPESTAAAGEFKTNLERYVTEARAVGVTPILVTPMHRRVFDSQGQLTHELQPYAESTKEVARKMNVPLVDLYKASGELFIKLGDTGSQDITASATDKTHFTEKGAIAMASMVATELADCDPKLAAVVRLSP